MVISANRFLNLEEMTVNAEHILAYLLADDWTRNSIAGMLGNMQTESTINPGIWQDLNSYDHDPYIHVDRQGYGLVQWTPFNKYTVWARDNGYSYSNINAQLDRIIYEVENGLQWGSTNEFPLSFDDFKNSRADPEFLAESFLINYERPADQGATQRNVRRSQARYWWDNLSGEGEITDPTDPNPPDGESDNKIYHLLLSGALNGW